MNLFQTGLYTLHSGEASTFKIECDNLTDADLETMALVIKNKHDFGLVIGVPTGGEILAEKLMIYENPKSNITLIVDDVLTTGKSMEEYHWNLDGTENTGVVMFARGPCADWITPIFQMWEN